MARSTARPGRTLVLFFLGILVLFGLVTLNGTWKPELGLDLQGGTRITLTAIGEPTAESLVQARDIIDQRVNGSGVAEADVTTQGGEYIIVEIPGDSRRDLVDTVKRQAQLRFRVVACSDFDGRCGAAPTPQQPGQDGEQQEVPGEGVTVQPDPGGSGGGGDGDGEGSNRAPVSYADKKNDKKNDKKDEDKTGGDGQQEPTDSPTSEGDELPDASELAEPLVWMDNPDPKSVRAFQEFQCPPPGEPVLVNDQADKPLVTCDDQGIKYLLSVSMIEGTELKSANAGIPEQSVDWAVDLAFDGDGTDKFTEISQTLFGTEKQFAIVLDGQVISAPTMNGIITNGQAQITGNFSEAEATSLATSLKFGALPISFERNPTVEDIGPSLAGTQLRAGMWAGGLGLGLVMLYCLFYYRGLGLVVLGSLAVAAIITYGMVLLLGVAAGFTLTLPGIAGLIIAVGVTADSFILFFERIRDEMREGKSMRVAVETGWKRAKVTRLAANTVSLLSAFVLYFFATGAVKGFGFALGLSTLIDLAVLFWFTKPMVSWLGRFTFFNGGGKLSGLSTETLGMDRVPAGGKV